MHLRKAFRIIYFLSCTLVLCSIPASAYIDPATTSYVIQIIAGLFISLGVVFGTFSAKIRVFFINLRVTLLKRKIAREAAKRAKGNPLMPTPVSPRPQSSSGVVIPVSKVAFLINDDRSLRQRLKLSSLVTFSFVFTFILFGILDLYISNRQLFPFYLKDILLPVLLITLIAFLLLEGSISLLKGRLFDIVLSLLFGVLLAGYMQGSFLNLELGQLTGDAIQWNRYTKHAVINLAVWIVVMILPLVLRYFSRNIWKTMLSFLSVLLIGMQSVGLISTISSSKILTDKQSFKYLSSKGLYELSPDDNVIILLLDRLDQKYIDDMMAKDPTFYDKLDGFTQFTNYTSYYCRTYPAAVNILTGALTKYDTPPDKFFTQAWKKSTFIPDLKKANYTTKLYMERPYLYNDIAQIDGVADNVVDGHLQIKKKTMIAEFLTLTAFRYVPHALKSNFHISTADFGNIVEVDKESAPFVTDDAAFYEGLKNTRLSLSESKKNFTYYHLNGMHDTSLDENVQLLPKGKAGSQTTQMKACFRIVYDFLDQMKELGVYKDSTIIIMGDHGKSYDVRNLDHASVTGLFVKPKGSAGTPLVRSNAPVSQEQIRSTIIKEVGLDNSAYGDTFFDTSENADVVRRFFYRVDRPGKKHFLEEFEIQGDAKDFKNWHKVGETKIKYVHG